MKFFNLLFLILISITLKSQSILSIDNGTYLKLEGNSKIILNTSIQKTGTTGGIWTQSESSQIIINVSNQTGSFEVPFVSSIGQTIPFSYDITTSGSSGGSISFSSYETGNNNLPLPSGVSNVNFNGSDNSSLVLDRFWVITPSGYTTKPEGVYNFTYDDNDLVGNSIFESNLFAQRWNSSSNTWEDWQSSPLVDPSNNTISININSSTLQYSVWTLVDETQPLPITLLSFWINCNTNTFNWTTASEVNNQYFILEGSDNGINWTSIDTLQGAGNSNSILNYQTQVKERFGYYRLTQVDFDGQSETFDIILGCQDKKDLSLFPNPNNGVFTINHNSIYLFEVYDMFGRLVWSERSDRKNFDLGSLNPGEYLIRILNKNFTKNIKFIKIN